MAVATEGGQFVRGAFCSDPTPLYRYIGDPARVTPCSKQGNCRIDRPRVCWDGSCPGYIDRRCSFCGEAVSSDLAHIFIPYSEYEALQAERGRC